MTEIKKIELNVFWALVADTLMSRTGCTKKAALIVSARTKEQFEAHETSFCSSFNYTLGDVLREIMGTVTSPAGYLNQIGWAFSETYQVTFEKGEMTDKLSHLTGKVKASNYTTTRKY